MGILFSNSLILQCCNFTSLDFQMGFVWHLIISIPTFLLKYQNLHLTIKYEKWQKTASSQQLLCSDSDKSQNSEESSHRVLIVFHQPYQFGSNKWQLKARSISYCECYSLMSKINKTKINEVKHRHAFKQTWNYFTYHSFNNF